VASSACRGRPAGPDLRAETLVLIDEMTPMLGFAPTLRLGSGLDARVPADVSEHSLAVLREALSNVARHAHATEVSVTVDVVPAESAPLLSVLVRDNGQGIPDGSRRSGLRNLAERAEKLGGTLRISPPAPRASGETGTELEWRAPVPAGQPAPPPAAAPLSPGRYPLR
jgi:signal transduction histidine kinase